MLACWQEGNAGELASQQHKIRYAELAAYGVFDFML